MHRYWSKYLNEIFPDMNYNYEISRGKVKGNLIEITMQTYNTSAEMK